MSNRPIFVRRRLSPTVLVTLLALLAAVLAAGVAAPAAEAGGKPCWRQLINDWYDGRIDRSYPIACYREAIKKLPPDVKTYSSAQEDFERALQAAIRQNGGNAPTVVPPPDVGRSVDDPSEDPDETDTTGGATSGGGDDGTASPEDEKGVLEAFEPANADSIPVPLLVLAGVAMLLLAAAAAGFIAKRIQERRVPVAPVAPGPDDGPPPPAPPA